MAQSDDEPPALAYIERTLAESYRKEIDQEENVWRSLPFFAAALALQIAALFQMIAKLPPSNTPAGVLSLIFLGLSGLLVLMSLGFLAACIYPQRFNYIAREPALLTYAQDLIHDEQDPANQHLGDPFSALATLKTELARQYAEGADHNRQINKRRERWRSIAGLSTLGSILMTVLLVAAIYAHYLLPHDDKELGHAALSGDAARRARPGPHSGPLGSGPLRAGPLRAGTGADTTGQGVQPAGNPPAAHAGGDKGLVDPSRGGKAGVGSRGDQHDPD